MTYYNIHTHHLPSSEEVIAIYNLIVYPDGLRFPEGREKAVFSKEDSLHKKLYYSLGIHPWYIDPEHLEFQLSYFYESVSHPDVVAVGEAGLDRLAVLPLEIQEEVFISQATIAEEKNKPLLIHCVKAWAEILALHKRISPRMPWIIHGFRGNRMLAAQLLNRGFYFSISDRFNEEILHLDLCSRLFLETDNRKIQIQEVYKKMASSLHVDLEKLGQHIRENVRNVFSI